MNTLMLVVVITLLFVVIWVARLHDQGRADDAARERRYRAEVRAAADREHAREALTIGACIRADHRNHVQRWTNQGEP